MAKVKTDFQCMICKERLTFPNDIDIVQFMILILQFYRFHEICENRPGQKLDKTIQAPAKSKKRGRPKKEK